MNDADPFALFREASLIKVPVLQVVDGDGFRTKFAFLNLKGNPRDHREVDAMVRLAFIDAPELEQRGGREARDFLTSLIGGQNVWIEIRIKMDTGKIVDRYGRIVAVPYLADWSLTRNVEIEMLLNGWAWLLERYGPEEIYFEALDVARRNKRGIWAWQDNVPPWIFKGQQHKDRRSSAQRSKTIQKCPAKGCVGSLVKRSGKFGMFYGCSDYPNCTYSRSI
jgi:endonuclease YncB( thermonuclease family)